jgi:hypothetical protein
VMFEWSDSVARSFKYKSPENSAHGAASAS